MSREYDDLHCQRIQFSHCVRIPAAATVLEVDGVRLPVRHPSRLAESPAPILFLARGVHAVRFRTTERPIQVKIEADLVDEYQSMRRYFDLDGSVRAGELMRRGAWAMDVHATPFLLNFTGAGHAKEGGWDVAERAFRRSLCVNPTFSPAHLNLAECLLRRKAPEEAMREINAADAFNVGNVYGLTDAINRLRRRLKMPVGQCDSVDADTLSYVTTFPLSDEDRRMIALIEGISKYAVKAEERAKTVNNLAVHFADTGKLDLALHHFRNALATVKYAGPERFAVAQKIFSNMSAVCRQAGLPEAEEYDRMQHLVMP
jgi:tetratricopeptide (TPR) repeat protein